MFLRCSYFCPNLSLDVLIDLVLNQKNACMFLHLYHFFPPLPSQGEGITDPGPPFHDVNAIQNCYFTGHNDYMA